MEINFDSLRREHMQLQVRCLLEPGTVTGPLQYSAVWL